MIQSKPSEKGEIIPSLSRMRDVLHDVEEGRKLIAVLVITVHAVGDGNKVDAVLPEEYLCVKAGLQIVTVQCSFKIVGSKILFSFE